MTRALLLPDGRPYTKPEVEALTKSQRSAGIVAPMFGGPHPLDDPLEYSSRAELDSLMSPFLARDIENEYADYADTITNVPGAYNDRFARRNPISDLNKPKDIYGILNLSMRYAEDHYIVNRCIKVKKNFATRQMTLLGKDSTKTFSAKRFKILRMRQWLSQIFRYYWITGRVVVYWGAEFPITGLCLLDPRFIIVRRFLTKELVYLRPDPRWVAIMSTGSKESAAYKFLVQNLPKDWIKHIIANEEIPLKDDTFALIENDLSLFSVRGIQDYTIGGTPLSAAFDALQISKMLMAGDFSVAWMIKNLVALVSIGDPKNEKDYSPPDQIALQKLASAFQRPEYSMNAYVDPTVNIRYITPDASLFDNKKYLQATQEIEYVMGVPGCFTGSGGDFASSAMSLKPFREDIEVARQDIIEQFFWKFLPIMREGFSAKLTGNADPEIEWDNDCLRDDKLIQDELNGKWDRGAISNRSLLEGKARDFDTELERKKDEKQYEEILLPLYSIAQGTDQEAILAAGKLAANPPTLGTNGGKGGRPTTTNKPSTEKTRGTPTPRPSKPT